MDTTVIQITVPAPQPVAVVVTEGATGAQGPAGATGAQGPEGPAGAAPDAASLATALNAGTQDTTAADTDRIAITSPAGGWMELGTLWLWITGKINTFAKLDTIVADAALARTDAGQTFAGNQVFSSPTRPTSSGTGTPAATSLVTRNDVLPEFLQYIPTALALSTTTGTANTNGANLGNSAVITVLNTAVAGNYCEVGCSSIPIQRSGSGANIRFSDSQFTLLFDMQSNGFWNNYYRFLFGVSSIQSLTSAGIGMEWTSATGGVIQIHDGTALYTQAFALTGFDTSKLHKFALVWNNGTLTLFWKGWNDYFAEGRFSQIATLTRGGLPTVMSGTNCKFVNVATGTPGTAMTLNIREAKFLATSATLA